MYLSLYPYLKVLHIVFVVTWFAGLFYIVRLFIYQTEAQSQTANAKSILTPQFQLMAKRLWYIITWPSACITLCLGLSMLPLWGFTSWVFIKLGLVAILYVYHLWCHRIFQQLQRNIYPYTSFWLRVYNEVPTLLLFAITGIAVMKNPLAWTKGLFFLVALGVLLFVSSRLYQKYRQRKEKSS